MQESLGPALAVAKTITVRKWYNTTSIMAESKPLTAGFSGRVRVGIPPQDNSRLMLGGRGSFYGTHRRETNQRVDKVDFGFRVGEEARLRLQFIGRVVFMLLSLLNIEVVSVK